MILPPEIDVGLVVVRGIRRGHKKLYLVPRWERDDIASGWLTASENGGIASSGPIAYELVKIIKYASLIFSFFCLLVFIWKHEPNMLSTSLVIEFVDVFTATVKDLRLGE